MEFVPKHGNCPTVTGILLTDCWRLQVAESPMDQLAIFLVLLHQSQLPKSNIQDVAHARRLRHAVEAWMQLTPWIELHGHLQFPPRIDGVNGPLAVLAPLGNRRVLHGL